MWVIGHMKAKDQRQRFQFLDWEVASVVHKAATSCYVQPHMLHDERSEAGLSLFHSFCTKLTEDNDQISLLFSFGFEQWFRKEENKVWCYKTTDASFLPWPTTLSRGSKLNVFSSCGYWSRKRRFSGLKCFLIFIFKSYENMTDSGLHSSHLLTLTPSKIHSALSAKSKSVKKGERFNCIIK